MIEAGLMRTAVASGDFGKPFSIAAEIIPLKPVSLSAITSGKLLVGTHISILDQSRPRAIPDQEPRAARLIVCFLDGDRCGR